LQRGSRKMIDRIELSLDFLVYTTIRLARFSDEMVGSESP
jgi:hypothetical protein